MKVMEISETTSVEEVQWQAVLTRDARFDGNFFYSVKTTGVYCRPSCGAKQPNRSNVEFHASREAAESAGFRACKRCKPNEETLEQRNAARIAEACRLIESSLEPLQLSDIAAHIGMSAHHFHRTFKAITGVTPKAFAEAHQNKRVRETLIESDSITDAIFDAGFNSSSRFYTKSKALLGMTPSEFRRGGTNLHICFAVKQSSLGLVLVATTERGICAILIGDTGEELVADLVRRFPNSIIDKASEQFDQTLDQVVNFIDAPKTDFELPLDIRGTVFQQRVWQELKKIPAGTTTSYSELAANIGAPSAVRAVASACAANPLAVAIPCHRAVRTDGNLSGYRWGLERKRALLKLESIQKDGSNDCK